MSEYLSESCKTTANEFNHRHWEEGESLSSIARSIGVFSSVLRWHVLSNGFKVMTPKESYALRMEQGGYGRKYFYDQSFFDVWTPTMAWILGLLASDGTVHRSGKQFMFANKDQELIQKYCDAIDYHGKTQMNNTGITMVTINSRKMVSRLNELGIVPGKSYILQYPDIPPEFHSHFIRGFFEGDGCIHVAEKNNPIPQLRMSIITASEKFAYKLSNILLSNGIKNRIHITPPKGNRKQRFDIWVGSYEAVKFYKFIYKDAPESLYLSRKKIIFDTFIQEHGHKYINGIAQREYKKRVPQIQCKIDGCNKPARRYKSGLCEMHYGRIRRERKKNVHPVTNGPTVESVGIQSVISNAPVTVQGSAPVPAL